MSDGSRHVLVLAYFFPPLGGAGVQRTLKALKYLPEHGWRATVVTTASNAYPAADASMAAEIPAGTRVVRARDPAIWRRLQTLGGIALNRLRMPRLRALVVWPDLMAAWGPFALLAMLREARRSRPDVIYSTSAPQTAHLVAWVVHRLTGIPWVADFRDEWSTNPHDELRGPAEWLNRRVERAVTPAAARVTVVADYFEIAGVAPERIVVIPNGVDEADFDGSAPARAAMDGQLLLSHVGTLYGDRDCAPVLAAMRRLVAAGRLDPGELELRIVGNDWLPDLDEQVPVALSKTGYVGHHAAIAEMRRADALLFYVAPPSLAPSGKLFEYLASGRPILCVTRPENLASRLVREWDAGITAEPGDDEAIERALLEFVERRRGGPLPDVPDARRRTLERYSRRTLAGRLAGVLADAAEGR